jgi:lysozyme family protein
MTSLERALLFTVGDGIKSLGYEGGYANDPNDRGGETFRGVARKHHPNWMGWEKVDAMKSFPEFPSCAVYDAALGDMVREFYVTEFWNKVHGDELPGKMAVAAFDCAVNSGPERAARLLQIALGGLVVDGDIGPRTVKAAHEAGEEGVVRFLAARAKFLHEIMDSDPTQKVWATNWFKRLFRLANVVLEGEGPNFAEVV